METCVPPRLFHDKVAFVTRIRTKGGALLRRNKKCID